MYLVLLHKQKHELTDLSAQVERAYFQLDAVGLHQLPNQLQFESCW